MESQHVARLAQKHNLPFAVIRVVLDDAQCSLPPAAIAATKPDGNISYSGLIGSLLKQPAQIQALLRLASANTKAKQSLLRCSHLLGGSSRFGFVDLR
jgi:hypothetical protein